MRELSLCIPNILLFVLRYAILHVDVVVRLRSMATQSICVYHLVTEYEPNVSRLCMFGRLVNVPIEPPKHLKFGTQIQESIYAGYEYPSIIHYLVLLTNKLFNARHVECDFNETIFRSL